MLPMMWFLEWVEKNQWIYLLLFCLGVVCAIISDFLLRKKILENISNSDYYLEYGESSFKRYYVEQRRKDIVMLVFSCIVIIGFIIFYLYYKKNEDIVSNDNFTKFMLGYFAFSAVFAFFRKDAFIRIVYAIPTFSLFMAISDNQQRQSNTYIGHISSSGNVNVTKTGGETIGFLGFLIGFPLFLIKITIILLYLFLSVLCVSTYVLFIYPLVIVYSSKKIKSYN